MGKFIQLGADIAKLWGKYASTYLSGMGSTIVIALLCTAVGCLIGLLCGILQTIPHVRTDHPLKRAVLFVVRACIRIYVEVFRGTPMILQAVVIYYALPYFSNNTVKFTSVWLAAFVVVSINTGAYMAEAVRGGIISIVPGQTEGAKAIGMNHVQTMTSVILPQAIRNIIPQIGNNFIINLKDTSVMFVIGFVEFFATHRNIVGVNLLYIPSATIEMIGYLCMTLIASFLLRRLEKMMDGNDSYELVRTDPLATTAGTYTHPKQPEDLLERNLETKDGGLSHV